MVFYKNTVLNFIIDLIPQKLNLTTIIFLSKLVLMTRNNKFNNEVGEPLSNNQGVTVE